MKGMIVFSVCFFLLIAQAALGQEGLSPNQTVSKKIEPGKTDLFSILLNDGDYFSGSIGYHGRINFFILTPDGTISRRLIGSSGDAKVPFVFAAEGAGCYSFKILNPGEQAATYVLAIGKVVSLNERLQPEPWSDPYPSPRIQSLRAQIAAGQTNTDSFWKQVAAEGTPFTEPYGSDGKYQLVTFLWKSQRDTRNVLVRGSFLGVGPATDYSMHRIANSDVWFLTLKLPSSARFTYQLSPNDPLTFDGPRTAERRATAQADPFNPRRYSCPPETSKFRCESLAELPGATPQPWRIAKPGTAEGRVEKQAIRSNIQKLDRGFSVYTPADYKTDGRPYPLLVLFDEDEYLSTDSQLTTTLNNLIAASKIEPTVTVLIGNVENRRLLDLIDNAEFGDSVARELIPWVRQHYNVSKDPQQTVVGGYSAGGFAAAYMGLRHPEVFGNVISQSGAFWWSPEHSAGVCGGLCPNSGGVSQDNYIDATTEGNWMAKQFLASPRLPLRFYLEAGTFEVDRRGAGGDILEATRHLRDVLLAKGYEVHYRQFAGGTTA